MKRLVIILVALIALQSCAGFKQALVEYKEPVSSVEKEFIGVNFCGVHDYNKDETIQYDEVVDRGSAYPDKDGNYWVVFHPEKLSGQKFLLVLEEVIKNGEIRSKFLIKDKRHTIGKKDANLVCKIKFTHPGKYRVKYFVGSKEYKTDLIIVKKGFWENYKVVIK